MIKKVVFVSIFIALFTLTFSQLKMVSAVSNGSKPTAPKTKPTPKPRPTAPKTDNTSTELTLIGASRIFNLN